MARCGGKMAVYSRIVGYIRPTSSWHRAKQAEFKQRRMFDVQASMQGPGPAKLRKGAEAQIKSKSKDSCEAEAEFESARRMLEAHRAKGEAKVVYA